MNPISDFRDFILQKRLAIVGASNDRSKYGNIVYRNLRSKGYAVFGVNPKLESVEGDKCYPNLKSLPGPVDGIVTIVPPWVTEKIVREAAELGITRVWMQEGSESADAIAFSEAQGMNTIYDQCVMVESNYRDLVKKEG
jgi:predicted CoA-binding protein